MIQTFIQSISPLLHDRENTAGTIFFPNTPSIFDLFSVDNSLRAPSSLLNRSNSIGLEIFQEAVSLSPLQSTQWLD